MANASTVDVKYWDRMVSKDSTFGIIYAWVANDYDEADGWIKIVDDKEDKATIKFRVGTKGTSSGQYAGPYYSGLQLFAKIENNSTGAGASSSVVDFAYNGGDTIYSNFVTLDVTKTNNEQKFTVYIDTDGDQKNGYDSSKTLYYFNWENLGTITVSALAQYTVSVASNNAKYGEVSGGGSIYYGKTTTIKATSKTGYHFVKWDDGNTDASRTVTCTGAKTYTATFAANTYTVTYDKNGGTGTTKNSSHTYGTASALTTNGFSRTGYTFLGWSTNSNATSATYTNGQKVSTLTADNGGTVKLYAVWKANTYTVTYNVNGGSGSMPNSTATYNKGFRTTKNTFTRSGYTFTGWNESANGTGTSWGITSASNGTFESGKDWTWTYTKNITLYAQWKANSYTDTIKHYTFGYKNKEGNNNDKTAFKLDETNFKKDTDSKFTINNDNAVTIPNGFYLENKFGTSSISGSWANYDFGTSVTQKPNTMTFQMNYRPIDYKIAYDLDNGTNNPSNPVTYNVLYGVTFAEPTRRGYLFKGWKDSSGKVITGINVGANATFTSADDLRNKLKSRTTGEFKVSAVWQPAGFTVYDAKGNKHLSIVTAYDSKGKGHNVIITSYDSDGKGHLSI